MPDTTTAIARVREAARPFIENPSSERREEELANSIVASIELDDTLDPESEALGQIQRRREHHGLRVDALDVADMTRAIGSTFKQPRAIAHVIDLGEPVGEVPLFVGVL